MDDILLRRALGILHRFALEQTGWRSFFQRWYYSDEPLRNDAANLVREAGFDMPRPADTEAMVVTDAMVDRALKAWCDMPRPAYTEAAVVTDAMVDRALKAWFASPPSGTDQGLERSMKAALEAALT